MELSVKETHTLIAPCVSCQCNNHSETCDPETGKCLVCTITHFSIGFFTWAYNDSNLWREFLWEVYGRTIWINYNFFPQHQKLENLSSISLGVHSVKLSSFLDTNMLKIINYFSFNFTLKISHVSVQLICFFLRLFGLLSLVWPRSA